MGKIVIGIVVLAVVLGGVGFWIQSTKPAQQQATQNTGDGAQTASAQEPSVIWAFTDAGEQAGVPSTSVMVVINGASYNVGKYSGSCNEIGDSGGIDGK